LAGTRAAGGRVGKQGKWQEESSFFEKKEAKKLYRFGAGPINHRVSREKSFFASFFSKKEDSSLLPLA
jgi:hypothetical protein